MSVYFEMEPSAKIFEGRKIKWHITPGEKEYIQHLEETEDGLSTSNKSFNVICFSDDSGGVLYNAPNFDEEKAKQLLQEQEPIPIVKVGKRSRHKREIAPKSKDNVLFLNNDVRHSMVVQSAGGEVVLSIYHKTGIPEPEKKKRTRRNSSKV